MMCDLLSVSHGSYSHQVSPTNMEEAGFMTYTATRLQMAIKTI